jgi:hypothetical protein
LVFDWDKFLRSELQLLGLEPPALIVGRGNSDLLMHIEYTGIRPVVLIHVSQTCCRNRTVRSGGCYLLMDSCQMDFRCDLFQSIIDKGTLQAIMCRPAYDAKFVREIVRTPTPNSVFIHVTFAEPEEMTPIFRQRGGLPWTLEETRTVDSTRSSAHVLVLRKFGESSN